jgi:DNA-binding transcriptional LysR family regulator
MSFMQLEPHRLLVLRAVARHGSVLAAAQALRVSPSAVSQQLAALERETGFALVDRSRRGGQRPIGFTSAGRRLIEHADRLAEVLGDAEADLGALAESAGGTVVVSAFFTALRGFAGTALAELRRSHPALQAQVREVDEAAVAGEVVAGRVDVAVVEDDAHERRRVPRGLRYEALVDDPFRLVVPVDWPDVGLLADIADRPWVDGPAGTALGHAMRRLRRTTGLAFPPVHSCREFTVALALVGAGLAGAFVPELALAAAPPPPTVRVSAPAGIGARRLGLLYRRGRHEPTPAVRAVLDAVRAAVPEGPHRPAGAVNRGLPDR